MMELAEGAQFVVGDGAKQILLVPDDGIIGVVFVVGVYGGGGCNRVGFQNATHAGADVGRTGG
jgi:hypothetical protein